MKALETLIRLRQQALDRQRQALGALQSRRAGIAQEHAALEASVAAEQALAASDQDLLFYYDAFARGVIEKRAKLDQLALELDAQIDAAILEVRAAFAELRKFEIARDKRLERERNERERVEQRAVDDLTITRLQHRALRTGH